MPLSRERKDNRGGYITLMMQIEGIMLEAFITGVMIFGRLTLSVPRYLMSSSAAGHIGCYDVGNE